MKPDIDLGENHRHREVSDEQTTTFVFNGIQVRSGSAGVDQGVYPDRGQPVGGVVDSVLRRWVQQLQQQRHGMTPKSKALTPEQQKILELGEDSLS
jgi:transposase